LQSGIRVNAERLRVRNAGLPPLFPFFSHYYRTAQAHQKVPFYWPFSSFVYPN
jgi:hypothetical protein